MEKLKKMLSGKKFVYYMTSSVMVVAVIGILLVLNMIVEKFEWKLDLTEEKKYSVSDETKQYLGTLKNDVNVYIIRAEGSEFADYYRNLIEDYKKASPKIKVQEFDPVKNPAMVRKYQLEEESEVILVEMGARYRKISLNQVLSEFNTNTASLESKLTGAINYVSDPREVKGYFVQGHGEMTLNEMISVRTRLEDSGMTLEEVDLSTLKEIPKDISVVTLLGPEADITDAEKTKLENYLQANGKLMVLLNPVLLKKAAELKNLSELLKQYNIGIQDNIVMETNPANLLIENPMIFRPELTDNEITAAVLKSRLKSYLIQARGLDILNENIEGLTVEAFGQSTEKSWGETNFNAQPVKDGQDKAGPLTVMAKAEKKAAGATEGAKMIVFGNAVGFTDEAIRQTGAVGNTELLANAIKWLAEYKETINIAPKTFKVTNVNPEASQFWITFIIVLLLPLGFLVGGIVTWVVRKKL